jgi:hypothetical protein
MANPTEWDRNAMRAMFKVHGIQGVVELVREMAEEVADPTVEKGEGIRCYFAINGLDDLLLELEKV